MKKFLSGPTGTGLSVVLGVAVLWLCGRSRPAEAAPEQPGPPRLVQALRLARSLNLHTESDPPGLLSADRLAGKIVVSERADVPEAPHALALDDRAFHRWEGTVAVYQEYDRGNTMFLANVNPDHRDRYARWGNLFVYGDPRLIRTLLAAWDTSPAP